MCITCIALHGSCGYEEEDACISHVLHYMAHAAMRRRMHVYHMYCTTWLMRLPHYINSKCQKYLCKPCVRSSAGVGGRKDVFG